MRAVREGRAEGTDERGLPSESSAPCGPSARDERRARMSEDSTTVDTVGDADGTWSDESEFTGWEDEADGDVGAGDETAAPTLAVVGRPNVGKSTLVNRLIGRREAVVQDVPGVTRDRVTHDALWRGRRFTVVDTGGWDPPASGLQAAVTAQAERAMQISDAVLVVVDGSVGATETEEAIARVLRRSRVPVILAVNKVDDERAEADAAAMWSLGLGEPIVVSALHGRGSGDLLDAVAGTTVDAVDSLVEIDGRLWRFVDTAGLRRRVNQARGMEYYASLRSQTALESAEVAIALIDSSTPITEQDQRVISMVIDSGRALVIALNKADMVDADRRTEIDRELETELARVTWAQRINVSARTGRGVHRIAPAMTLALQSWDRRIPTGRLNSWLGELIAATPPPVRGGKQPRVLFATQASNRPPTFVLFTTGFLEAGYRRFVERRLREDFDFTGSPVRVNVRVREKRAGRKK